MWSSHTEPENGFHDMKPWGWEGQNVPCFLSLSVCSFLRYRCSWSILNWPWLQTRLQSNIHVSGYISHCFAAARDGAGSINLSQLSVYLLSWRLQTPWHRSHLPFVLKFRDHQRSNILPNGVHTGCCRFTQY